MNPNRGQHGMNSDQGGLRPALILFTALCVPLLSGCESLLRGRADNPDEAVLTEIRRFGEDLAAARLEFEVRLEKLEEKLQLRTGMVMDDLDDLDRSLRNQTEEVAKLRDQIEDMTYRLGVLEEKLSMPAAAPAPAAPAGETRAAPATAQGEFDKALREYNLGRYRNASDGFETALSLAPDEELTVRILYWLGESHYALNDLVSAYDRYNELIEENPTHDLAWQSLDRLAEISRKYGNNDAAAKIYEHIINQNPSYPGIANIRKNYDQLRNPGAGAAHSTAPAAGGSLPDSAP